MSNVSPITSSSPRTKKNFYQLVAQSPRFRDAGISKSAVKKLIDDQPVASMGQTRSKRVGASLRRCLRAWLSGVTGVINGIRRALHHIADYINGILISTQQLVKNVHDALQAALDCVAESTREFYDAAGELITDFVDDAYWFVCQLSFD